MEREPTEYTPASWCKDICMNAGRPGCVYDCAEERKARYFLPNPDLTIDDLAPFPSHTWFINSSPQERQAIAGLYLSKLTEAITGVPQDEERDRLKKELDAASDERLLEIVGEVISSGVVYEAED